MHLFIFNICFVVYLGLPVAIESTYASTSDSSFFELVCSTDFVIYRHSAALLLQCTYLLI